ncbi:MAG: nucleoside-diphosphate sugar epimerase [Sphingobacteriaceae bacterium]|nr:MAG: nucleoside-diphosphate sugar epimerase [Sphingobacteriaceae bacterium]
MYTIMGASGHVGFAVVKELTAQNLPVRAVLHQREKAEALKKLGAEVVFADTFELPSLLSAFRGSKAVFLITPETGQNADLIADTKTMLNNYRQAIVACAVKKVVGLSSIGAHLGAGSGNLEMSHLLEHAFDGLEADQVFLRPAYYFSNWLMGAQQVKRTGLLYSFYPPNLVIPMVSPEDVARIVADLLTRTEHGKKVYEMEGPAEYAPEDVAQAMSDTLGRFVKVNPIPKQDWESVLKKIGFSHNAAENFIKMTECVVNGQARPEGKGISLLKGTTSLEQFIKSAFRSSIPVYTSHTP